MIRVPVLKNFKVRVILFVAFCLIVLGWNLALSTRRKYFSGSLVAVRQEDLTLKVLCGGKIEPKVQDTIRSLLEGPKKELLVREGDMVKMGQLLMEIGDDNIRLELINKRNALHNAEEEFSKAIKEYRLNKSLYRQLAVSKRDVETAKQAVDRAGQTVASAKEEMNLSKKKATGVKVYSTLDGVVLKVYVENENWISSGKELFKVAQVDHFIMRGQVDELDISRVSLGQMAKISCDAFAGAQMQAKVGWIGAQAADGGFADVQVALDIIDTQGLNLKSNLTAEASIEVGNIPQAIVIPEAALRRGANGLFVLTTRGGGWLKEQPVVVVQKSAGQAVIKEGIKPGDTVLVPKED